MSVYRQKGSRIWWYEFRFNGKRIRESAKTASKKLAIEAERARRRQLEQSYNGVKKFEAPKTFSEAAKEYVKICTPNLAKKSMEIINRSVKQLAPFIGRKSLPDITIFDIQRIVAARRAQGSSNRYINMTIETLRAIMRRNHQWERLRPDYKKLKEPKNIGKELSMQAERRLLEECRKSPSRILYPAVVLGLYAGLRSDEIRCLRWSHIDLEHACLTVGKSKTVHGEGRIVPLIGLALDAMRDWAACFPHRLPSHFVFSAEKYAYNAAKKLTKTFDQIPSKPIGSWKKTWGTVRRNAGVQIRFHDLRHTTVSRLLDAGCTLEQIAPILGWSATTMAEMMLRYQHRTLEKRRQTMLALVSNRTEVPDIESIVPLGTLPNEDAISGGSGV